VADPSRSEPATPRRKREARERGQVARSGELTAALVLLAVLLFFRFAGAGLLQALGLEAARWWGRLGGGDPSPETALASGLALLERMLSVLAPLLALAACVALVANVAQVGVLFTTRPIEPKLDNLNPVQGFQRIFSQRTAVDLAKSLIKLFLIAWVVYASIRGGFEAMIQESAMPVGAALATAGELAWRTGIRVVLVLLAIAFLDYLYQRDAWERSLRMTRQEVKDEFRQMEGDPLVKSRIRQLQREAARRRMISEVPRADVVITNPIHLAVAVRYDPGVSRAPSIVAKGARLVAERIKEVARANGVPIWEDPPLARALFEVRVGAELPPALYHAVAQILAYVYHAGRKDKAERAVADALERRARRAVAGG
jgi:flagellar biosynthetic protein FlhB